MLSTAPAISYPCDAASNSEACPPLTGRRPGTHTLWSEKQRPGAAALLEDSQRQRTIGTAVIQW